MTKESFIQDRHFFRFEVTPLDVNLAKIQMNLEKRTMQELPDSGNFGAIIEKFELFNPELLVSYVEVGCYPKAGNYNWRELILKVRNKDNSQVYSETLISGNSQRIKEFISSNFDSLVEGQCFMSLCKGLVYWINDLEVERVKTFRDYMNEVIERVLVRINKGEIPFSGAFPKVEESFQNPDEASLGSVSCFALCVYKMNSDIVADPSKRFVDAIAYSSDGAYKSSLVAASGTNQEITDMLKSPDFLNELEGLYAQLLDVMESSEL